MGLIREVFRVKKELKTEFYAKESYSFQINICIYMVWRIHAVRMRNRVFFSLISGRTPPGSHSRIERFCFINIIVGVWL